MWMITSIALAGRAAPADNPELQARRPASGQGVNRKLERIVDALWSGSPTEWIVFIAVSTVIAGAIWALSRYRLSLRGDADPAAADALLVRHVRDLRDSGAVSEDEYRSLKCRLSPPTDETSRGTANDEPTS